MTRLPDLATAHTLDRHGYAGRRDILRWLAAMAPCGVAASNARSAESDASTRPLRWIVGFAAGDGSDLVVRWVAERMAQITGRPFVVENRTGGENIPAVQALLASPADGDTLMMVSQTVLVMNPLLRHDLPYDARRDFRLLAGAFRLPAMVAVSAQSPHTSLAALCSHARAHPGEVSIGSHAVSYRVAAAALAQHFGVTFNHVPYRLPSQATNDLISGTLQAAMVSPPVALRLKDRLRVLAGTGAQRLSQMPDVPTVTEAGLGSFEMSGAYGFAIHGRTPEPIARRIGDTLLKVLQRPDFGRFVSESMCATWLPERDEAFARSIEVDVERTRRLLEKLPDRGR